MRVRRLALRGIAQVRGEGALGGAAFHVRRLCAAPPRTAARRRETRAADAQNDSRRAEACLRRACPIAAPALPAAARRSRGP